VAQLALQGGIARLFAVVVLGGSFGLVLVMGILRHVCYLLILESKMIGH
jgi:hypothetical protein